RRLRAQTEIADTYYLQGKFEDAVDFLTRLLKLPSPDLDKAATQARLIRALARLERNAQIIPQAEQYLGIYTNGADLPEVRYLLAASIKALKRERESLEQVKLLLDREQATAKTNPQNWIYWQQRAGNEIANELYRDGSYLFALDVYRRLAELDTAPAWQLPVWYQIGLCLEKLLQPERALQTYEGIIVREKEVGPNAPENLKTVLDFAKSRRDHLQWAAKAAQIEHDLQSSLAPSANTSKSRTNEVKRAAQPK
ncbi:MAG: tetratricopeptide repeat protein, partial [Verrucomicrobia bacterium]|nr:tetratricopeptide repeat protein [Verrucomicrobiota bacterium]